MDARTGIPAFHFDGSTAFRHSVTVEEASHGLRLVGDDAAVIGGVLYADLVWREDQGGLPVYGLTSVEGWRLGFLAAPSATMAAQLPRAVKYGGVIDRLGLPAAMGAFAVVSVAAVLVFMAMPQWLAPMVPYSWEQKMGDVIVGDFGGRLCHTDAGQAALDRLEAKLDARSAKAGGRELDVRVANIDMINAVALPGGKIIIFQGLLEKAKSPEELAGVLAHEIGHVRRRHVMQSLLRQLGLSFLLGGIDGQAGGALNTVLSLAYGRDAERDADLWSIDRMAAARIDPTDTADFFERMSGMDNDDTTTKAPENGAQTKAEAKSGAALPKTDEAETAQAERALSYITTHPANVDRTRAFMGSKKAGVRYVPAMPAADWDVLLTMCDDDPDVKESTNGLLF